MYLGIEHVMVLIVVDARVEHSVPICLFSCVARSVMLLHVESATALFCVRSRNRIRSKNTVASRPRILFIKFIYN